MRAVAILEPSNSVSIKTDQNKMCKIYAPRYWESLETIKN